jgi:RHS repeat-associated protein
MNHVTGPGLPAGTGDNLGVYYTYDSASDVVHEIQVRNGSAAPALETTRAYETSRNLLDYVENVWRPLDTPTTISKYDYTNDRLGRRSAIANSGTAARPSSYDQTLTYNDRNELTGATRGGSPYGWTRGYEYDSIGNRQSQDMGAVQTTYTSNELNQYTYALGSDSAALFPMYDADGNMTLLDVAGDLNCDGVVNGSDISPFTLALTNPEAYHEQYPNCDLMHADIVINGGGGTRFEWDAENRLVRVAPAAPYDYQSAVEYAYDYRGRLVAKVAIYWDPEQSPPGWVESDRRKFVWSDWLLLAELDADDQPLREYTWGLDVAGQNGQLNSLESAGGIGGLLAVHDLKDTPDPGNDVNYAYAYDGNGNVVQVLDWAATSASTVRKARYEYDPYGNAITIFDIGAYNRQPFRFSTKIWDADVGMVYYGYRWYWPTAGRWTSEDPIGDAGGANLQVYAGNCPPMRIDALGLYGPNVHRMMTTQWAEALGMTAWAADAVGVADNAIDSNDGTNWWPYGLFGGDQAWHFNRSAGAGDTRLGLSHMMLMRAMETCTVADRDARPENGYGLPWNAATYLGYALHPTQDFWAHGDFSKGPQDIIGSASVWVSHGYDYDTWGMDAVGTQEGVAAFPDGRAPQVFTTTLHVYGPGGMPVAVTEEDSWKSWQPGQRRNAGVRADTQRIITQFLDVARTRGNCACRRYFLGQ